MPEAITKYAINSTLGTAEFQPLDKLIESILVDHTGLAGGNNIVASFLSNWSSSSRETTMGTFTPQKDGVVSIKFDCMHNISNAASYFGVYIRRSDGEGGYTLKHEFKPSTEHWTVEEITRNINVEKGVTYTIGYDTEDGRMNNLAIGVANADPTLLEYTIEGE